MYRDYRPIPGLDRYDGDELDQDDYDAMSPGARAAAERELLRRDREEGTGRRDADYILYGMYCVTYLSLLEFFIRFCAFVQDEHDDDEASRKKRRMAERAAAGFIVDDEQDEDV